MFVKINDRQFIEVFPEKEAGTDRLNHIALEVEDAEAMRAYLASRGVKVPEKVPVGRIGNANFNIIDPDGHTVEIVQYLPDGKSMLDRGQNLPGARISPRMTHVGIAVGSLDGRLAFYGDILGFRRPGAVASTGQGAQLGEREGSRRRRLRRVHALQGTPDLEPGWERCITSASRCPTSRPPRRRSRRGRRAQEYSRDMEIKTGVNRKRQLNLYDPDGTRIELMEPKTVDGTPHRPPTAPPPQATPASGAGSH